MPKIAVTAALFFLSLWCSAWADADGGITLRLDRTSATLTDTVRMEVRISGTRNSDISPGVHGLEAFRVTRGGTSSRIEVINGKVSAGLTFTYYLQPRKTGTFTIGPAAVQLDGRIMESNSETLVVKVGAERSGTDRGPVFMDASISPADVFVAEQAIYTLKLYHRVGVDNLSLSLPEIEHMVFKQLGPPREYQATREGVTYGVLEVRYALSASTAGTYGIGPSRMRLTVRQKGSRSAFDDFFNDPFFKTPFSAFAPGRPLTVATDALELQVSALPEAGKPEDFSGLVGDFKMTATLAPAEVKAGESATLTVRVSGRGNVNRIPDISLPEMPSARTYGDQPVLETEMDGSGFGGKKTMKWAVVPEKAGRFDIPVLTLSFFNPETEQYTVLETPAHTLSVLPGETPPVAVFQASPGGGQTARGPAKKEIRQIGKDILPIHTTAGDLSAARREPAGSWFFWLAGLGPLSVYLMLWGGLKLRRRTPERLAQLTSKNAFKALARRCRQGQPDSAGLIDAFKGYLNDKFDRSIGTLTAHDAEKLLLAVGVRKDTAQDVCAVIRRLENAVYTGEDPDYRDAANHVLEMARTLDREIR